MEKKNWRELFKQCFLVNLAAWLVALLFFTAVEEWETALSIEHIVAAFVYSNCIGTLSSIVIFWVSPKWALDSTIARLGKVSASIFLVTLVGVLAARAILSVVFPAIADQGLIPGRQNFVFALGIALIVSFGVYFFDNSQTKLRQSVVDAEYSKTLATHAKLASLESRIHPHFLFNTLNSIAALIRDDPFLAEKMVERLSALLRYSLDVSTNRLVPLSQELEISTKYLEIEKARFGNRLTFAIETSGELSPIKVPPLALQTIVENSIKHVASVCSGTTSIGISIVAESEEVCIAVSDNGPGFSDESVIESHGLDLLRGRLAAIFGDCASLAIGSGSVVLRIPVGRSFDHFEAQP